VGRETGINVRAKKQKFVEKIRTKRNTNQKIKVRMGGQSQRQAAREKGH